MSAVIALSAAVALGPMLTVLGWVLLHLRGQQSRIQQRLDNLSRRFATGAAASVAAPAGRLAPPFDLANIEGEHTSLAGLLESARPLVLVFTDPRCGPCYELLPDIGGWQRVYGDRLTFALVSSGTSEQNRALTAEYGIAPATVLIQTEREIADAYGALMAPAAVLIHPDGYPGGEMVYGAHAVRRLVAETLGLALPDAPSPEVAALRPGQQVRSLRRPDLAGMRSRASWK